MSNQFEYVNTNTGRRHCVGGCIPSRTASTAPLFALSAKYKERDLPRSVDLRQFMTPVEDQGNSYSCVGNALAGAYEFLIKKNTGRHVDVSRLFIYYNSRIKDGLKEYNMKDIGTCIPHAIEALVEFGCCKEDMFRFEHSNINQKPPDSCYTEAHKYRIKRGMQLRTDLNEMKACLAEGYPFVFGLMAFQSFHQAATNGGRVPMPNLHKKESQNQAHGWHAMVAAGYSDRSRCFIVQNSWGDDWGHRGYCYIPYEYMSNNHLCQDLHSIKMITHSSSHNQSQTARNVTDDQQFWRQDDPNDYYHAIWEDKSIERRLLEKGAPTSYILWMDDEKAEIARMTKHLSNDPRVQLTFQPTFALGRDYILRNSDQIRLLPQSSIFQIICRGYYASEDKNALDLLAILNQIQLDSVPMVVITSNKSTVLKHFKQRASNLGIRDWKSRIYVTNNDAELITKINANFLDKYVGNRQ